MPRAALAAIPAIAELAKGQVLLELLPNERAKQSPRYQEIVNRVSVRTYAIAARS